MGADGGLRQGKKMELWKVAETAQFGGHTVVASMRLFFFDLPIYQPNATIHVAKYTSPMDGIGIQSYVSYQDSNAFGAGMLSTSVCTWLGCSEVSAGASNR